MSTVPLVGDKDQKQLGNNFQPIPDSSNKLPVHLQEMGGAGPNNINWINSSYAGVDIKVVANLYKNIGDAADKNSVNEQATAHAVVEGATNAQGSIFSINYNPKDNLPLSYIFETICFPQRASNEVDLQALQILQTNLGKFVAPIIIGKNPQASGQFITASNNLISAYQAKAAEMQDQMETRMASDKSATSVLELGGLQTMSIQSHREKTGVRSLGKSYVHAYVRGPITLAGSMIFTVFDEHPLYKLIRAMGDANLYGAVTYNQNSVIATPDQLPPIDLTVVFANEYGSISRMGIYGVEFINDGMTMSVEDLLLEEVMQFTARDVDIMTSVGMMKLSQANRGIYNNKGSQVTGSELYYNNMDSYQKYCDNLGIRRKFLGK